MKSLCLLLTGCVLVAGGVFAQTQSITTPPNFASNNGGSAGGAVYFDVSVLQPTLVIQNVDLNCSAAAGTAVTIDIYTCPTTYVGNEAMPGAWTLVASCSGTSLGSDTPTPIDMPDFAMLAGDYGMAIVNSGGHRYTNGNGANQAVADANLSLTLGAAANVAFSGTPFSPRVANATLYYDLNGTPSTVCIQDRQPNSAESSLTVDGGSSANLVNGAAATVDMASTNAGSLWDVGIVPLATSVGALTGSGIVTPGGQSVNVDLSNPAFLFLNNDFTTGGGFPAGGLNFAYSESNYLVSGQMAVVSATLADGIALSQACDLSWVGCQGADFESGVPGGWANPGPSWGLPTIAWTVDFGGTPSGNTGPTSGNGGSTNYIYCETSGGAGNGASEFTLDTCVFDVSSLTNFQLDFALSRIGATMGTLDVYMFTDAGGWGGTPVMSFTGADPTQTQGGTEWSAESYAITALPLGTTGIAFSFTYVGGGSFTGDIALDDVSVN